MISGFAGFLDGKQRFPGEDEALEISVTTPGAIVSSGVVRGMSAGYTRHGQRRLLEQR
jgi:hypothetical protein